MQSKVIEFALNFLQSNLEDPEVEAMLAVHLGLVEDEEDYEGESLPMMQSLVEQAKGGI